MSKPVGKSSEIIDFLRNSPFVPNDKIRNLAVREESLFMSLMLKDKEQLREATETGITYACFQNDITRQLFQMAAEHIDQHDSLLTRPALDSILAGKMTPEGAAMFRSKYDAITAEFGVKHEDFSMLKENIEARYTQRQAYAICQKYLEELMSSTRDQKKIVAEFQNYVSEISAFGDNKAFVDVKTLSDVMVCMRKELIERRDNPEGFCGIRCLYPKIDADYNGFQKGRYMVITATEGGGKTTFMLNLARNFAIAGNSVVYVTIESSNMDIGRRILTMHAKVSYSRVMRGGKDNEFGLSPYIMDELGDAADNIEKTMGDRFHLIQVLEHESRDKICRLIQRVRAYKPVDVVFIDYLQVVGKEVNFGERVDQAIADVSSKFRAWGRKRNVLLITANQIKSDKGRKLQDKVENEDDIMITKGDTSGSKEISGAADYMFGCWIPLSRDRMILFSTKNRTGKDTQKYTLSYDADSGRIEQMGEFGDVENVAAVITDKKEREKLRRQLEDRDSTTIMDVPGERTRGDTPPDEIVSGGAGAFRPSENEGFDSGGGDFLTPGSDE